MKKYLLAAFIFLSAFAEAQTTLTYQQIVDMMNTRNLPVPSTNVWYTLYNRGFTGTLNSGYIPYATGPTTLADGLIYQAGNGLSIGSSSSSSVRLYITGTGNTSGTHTMRLQNLAGNNMAEFRNDLKMIIGSSGASATIQYYDGNQGAGKILSSDASGNASWSTASSIFGSGTQNYLSKWNNAGGTILGNSIFFDDGTNAYIKGASTHLYFDKESNHYFTIPQSTTSNTDGGGFYMEAAPSSGSAQGGFVSINGGYGGATGIGGGIFITSGLSGTNSNSSATGPVWISSNSNSDISPSGDVLLRSGQTNSGTSGSVTISSGASTLGNTGNLVLQVGIAGGTAGALKLVTGTPASGKIFTCTNVDGTGTWSTLSGAGAVGGTGTQYFHTMWNNAGGTTIGNSMLFENGNTLNLTNGVARTLQVQGATSPGAGNSFTIASGAGNSNGDGGLMSILAGAGGTGTGNGGATYIDGGGTTGGAIGNIYVGTINTPPILQLKGTAIKFTTGTPGVGKVLTDDGSGTGIATWSAPATSGTVTSVATSYGLTGGTITSTGTLKVDTTSGSDGGSQIATEYYVNTHSTTNPFSDASALVKNSSDATKLAIFSAAGITTGTTRTYTLPNFNGTLATLAGTEAFTNKTITAPVITSPTITVGSDATGDIYYNGGSGAFTRLADVATGSVLVSGGAATAPAYSAAPTLTTSLTTPLVIGGTGAGSSLSLQSTSGVGSSDLIKFLVGNNGATEAARFTTAGKLMIGATATAADELLTVRTAVSKFGMAHTDGTRTLATFLDANAGWFGTVSNHPLYFFTNNSTQSMVLNTSGNLGINSTTPGFKLDVAGAGVFSQIKGGLASGGGVKIGAYNSTYGGIWSANITPSTSNFALISDGSTTDFGSTGAVAFQWFSGATAIGVMNSTGGLSLGTSSGPSARLHVVSTAEQLRLQYDGSNYFQTTVGSTGAVTLNTNGSGSLFSFSDNVGIGTTTTNATLDVSGFINWSGQKRVSTQYDATTTTLGDVTGLSVTVAAGKTYEFTSTLWIDGDATGGVKVAIGGTATATAIIYENEIVDETAGGVVEVERKTALGGSSASVTGDATYYVRIKGTITVNAGGTLTTQFAQSAASGTSSVLVGSTFIVNQIN